MAETKLRLEIVTPEKKVLSEDVDFVVVPGELGELGILPNHTPLMSSLKIGEIRITTGNKIDKLAISGGFVEVTKKKVTVLADTAELSCDIDVERAERAKERAERRLAKMDPDSDLDYERARLALLRAINRLKVAN